MFMSFCTILLLFVVVVVVLPGLNCQPEASAKCCQLRLEDSRGAHTEHVSVVGDTVLSLTLTAVQVKEFALTCLDFCYA